LQRGLPAEQSAAAEVRSPYPLHMALGLLGRRGAPSSRSRWSVLALGFVTTAAVIILGVLAVALWSSPSLEKSSTALARVELPPFAGSLEFASAYGPSGQAIPLTDHNGLLVPHAKLAPGEIVTVDVVVRRPGWLSWALGSVRHEQLTIRAPVAHVAEPWLTLAPGTPLRVSFDQPVAAAATLSAGHLVARRLTRGSLVLHPHAAAGSIEIRAAARSWERLGTPRNVTWFPPSRSAALVVRPAANTTLRPTAAIHLTFSRPVAEVLGSSMPRLLPSTAGSWHEPDSHTLVFTPSGTGFPLATTVQVELPHDVDVSQPPDGGTQPTTTIDYSVAGGSTLRLQQLLAELGYLPVDWTARSAPVARTAQAQVAAAVDPPTGTFSWRYPKTPSELEALWHPGASNAITKGAVMTFEDENHLTVDGIAGPEVWQALLNAAIGGQRHTVPYSYVYVHALVPESLTLWSAGHVVLRSPGNTGIPESPTQHGTFAVYEHIPVGTMRGTNPDGSHYDDPGIRYISYFNGGDAIHEFPRGSYGTPQSLGCVELPLAAAAKVWPYTPIGTLVTVEK
jgi:peptidoglycan hydrolase-like protein with peptidoglycan-binding domain